ncbi:DUF4041 domain-containing protein [Lacticaseibacillus paracasei]|uniref:DUF4041 domain-containing protein n=1 Tax=Lacticaseibacillus paracasei TaxID=1597 RepID=UPI0031F62211
MGILDIFKSNEFKQRIESLELENTKLKQESTVKLTLQQMTPIELKKEIDLKTETNSELDQMISKNQSTLSTLTDKIANLNETKKILEGQLVSTKGELEIESFGLYKPRYTFANSLGYKARLDEVRQNQKNMIKGQTAFEIFMPISFNGSASKGRSIQKKNGKQLLRSFNGETEAAINKITYSNFDRINNRLEKSFQQLNKLNEDNGIRLSPAYLDSKVDELHLAYEYEQKKQEEREELREQREREREEKQAQKQMHDAQKKLDKELDHYKKAYQELQTRLENLQAEDQKEIQSSLEELQKNIDKAESEKKDLDYRQENATAGYVYIISNIGSFGKDVVKIGVTRRLDPLERVAELGSASVPFKFDVHALIFSYDAYALEAELHQRFANQRVNKVNNRKEYFRVPIRQIESALEEYKDLTVDFTESPDAPEYRQSLAINSKNFVNFES